jgi:hypothetical protein
MTIDFDSTQPGLLSDFGDTTLRTRALGTESDCSGAPMSAREWLSLGALCAKAAEDAKAAGLFVAARHYAALARKCDRMLDES